MPVYTAELYPTSIRNVGVGACNVAAGIALILTPYLDILVSRTTVMSAAVASYIDHSVYVALQTVNLNCFSGQVKIEIHLLMAMLTAWCIFGGVVVIFLPEYNNRTPTTAAERSGEQDVEDR